MGWKINCLRFPGVPSSRPSSRPYPIYLRTFRINITLDSRHFFHHRYKAEINYAGRCFSSPPTLPSPPPAQRFPYLRRTTADIGVYTSFLFLSPRRPFYSRLFDSRFVLRRRRFRVSFRYNRFQRRRGIKSVVSPNRREICGEFIPRL